MSDIMTHIKLVTACIFALFILTVPRPTVFCLHVCIVMNFGPKCLKLVEQMKIQNQTS